MGTALAPQIGYDAAAILVKNAYLTGRTVREVAVEQSGLTPEKLNELLDPERQAG
jgi:fumarate hydratase class II